MATIVPFVPGMLEARTLAWADENDALPIVLSCADPTDYWDLLASWWFVHSSGEDGPLVVVEQDVLPADGVVDDMAACPELWCSSPYQLGTGVWLDEGLGCTKFSADLMAAHPDLMARVGEIDDDGLPAKDWHRLDVRIARVLRDLGYAPHTHRRSKHLHDYTKRP